MAFMRSGSKVQSKINAIVYGAQWSGKSTYAASMAKLKRPDGKPFRVLICDAEMGSADEVVTKLADEGVQEDNILLIYSQSLNEINYYIDLAAKREDIPILDDEGNPTNDIVLDADGQPVHADALVIDGSTVIKMACQQSLLNMSRKRAKVRANKNNLVGDEKSVAIDSASLEMKDWGNLSYSGQSLILNLCASGLNWIVTCREKEKKDTKMVNGTIQSVSTGIYEPDSFSGILYNSKTVLRFTRDEDEPDIVKMIVEKDRTGTYSTGQVIENPQIEDWQPLISNKVGKDFTPRNTMEQAIDIETRMYEKQAGIVDDGPEQSLHESSIDPKEIKAQIKEINTKLYPDQKKEFGNRLKSADLPTQISKIEDTSILTRILEIAKEVSEEKISN